MRNYLIVITFFLVGCGGEQTDAQSDEGANKKQYEQIVNYVDTMHLTRGGFTMEMISNGRLRAVQKSDLTFKGSGYVEVLNYGNGDPVSSGSVIAVLNSEDAKLRLQEAQNTINKAELDYQDALLGFGYSIKDTTGIPLQTRMIARIKSGYNSAKTNLETAKNELDGRIIKAPFSGRVANLKTKQYENPKGDFFCSVINDNSFDVEFAIIESEVEKVKVGMDVGVSTFSNLMTRYRGKIKSINPTVDEKGQVMVAATVSNSGGRLVDGMNVKVFVESRVANRLIVPKSAVLIRDNKEVLFTFGDDGKAHWTYVYVESSNSTHHAVVANKDRGAELDAGAVVITSGNLNLADGSDVQVKNND